MFKWLGSLVDSNEKQLKKLEPLVTRRGVDAGGRIVWKRKHAVRGTVDGWHRTLFV